MGGAAMDSSRGEFLKPGQKIGGCAVEAVIAQGGLGVVYRARKELLAKTVAVKVLYPAMVARADNLSRFLREAKVASSLDHPSIVKVYDVGEDAGRYYMVMEYVDGSDLSKIVHASGPFSPRKALRVARRVAEALAYAHERGVVHRDVKPANILLTPSGDAKLVDFGLARPIEQDVEVTTTGQIVGTPVYMSPEQCRGDPIDGRSDLYSLGATLYMLLSGKPPFSGSAPPVLIHRVIHENPPPLKTLVEVPDKVVALVQRLMAKHPGARCQTAQELIGAIDETVLGRFVLAREERTTSTPRIPSVVPRGAMVFLALLVAAAVLVLCLLAPQLGTLGSSAAKADAVAPARAPRSGANKDSRRQSSAATKRSRLPDRQIDALQGRLNGFFDRFPVGSEAEILEYVVASKRTNPDLRAALMEAVHTVRSRGLNSVSYSIVTVADRAGETSVDVRFRRRGEETRGGLRLSLRVVQLHDVWHVRDVRPARDEPGPEPSR